MEDNNNIYSIPDDVVTLIDEEVSENNGTKPETSSSEGSSVHTETRVSESSPDSVEEQLHLTNCLLVGIILFIGVFFGAFCMAHLFNRIRKS